MSDGRVIVGIFLCTDRSGNVIIGRDRLLGKHAKQIFGKSWDFGPTGLTPPSLPESWDFSVDFSEIFGKKGSNMP